MSHKLQLNRWKSRRNPINCCDDIPKGIRKVNESERERERETEKIANFHVVTFNFYLYK